MVIDEAVTQVDELPDDGAVVEVGMLATGESTAELDEIIAAPPDVF